MDQVNDSGLDNRDSNKGELDFLLVFLHDTKLNCLLVKRSMYAAVLDT